MSEWYLKSEEAALKELRTSRNGLTQKEAQRRLQENGENALEEGKRKRAWQVFLEQFQDLLVLILIAAAVISMISGNMESTAVIFAVITLNAVLGTVQHEKAQKSLDSLKKMTSPSAHVMRDGRLQEIESSQVVPGDIVMLETGDLAAADGRLLECHNLQMNESSLTGESVGVEKQAGVLGGVGIAPADQKNMVFSGSLVIGGRGVMAVTATGMHTEIGKIASMMNETEEKKTPLQVSLDQFGGRLAAGIMMICAAVFALSLYRGEPVLEALMFAVALAVAAIPEALGSIVTIVQAMGTQQMAKEHAVIKDLKAVESLGCVSVICSDKTGTLTQNKMSVHQVFVGNRLLQPGQLSPYDPVHRYLLYASVLNNDASPDAGDPTELALLEMGMAAGVEIGRLRAKFPRLDEIPFDSSRKLMSTLHQIDGQPVLLIKGAADVLLERCGEILTPSGTCVLTVSGKQKIQRQNQDWSGQGLRVLGMAYVPLGKDAPRTREEKTQHRTNAPGTRGGSVQHANPSGTRGEDVRHETNAFGTWGENMPQEKKTDLCRCCANMEQNCIWIGMAAMMDPPRAESRTAVLSARRAGIRPVMITGDHKATAAAIASRVEIFLPGDLAVTGAELDAMDDGQLQQQLDRISVYARVSPEHKIRIVDAWQSRGHIVAMTGDGVNDAPALKKADIGVAMGITGTEVSKDAASMILTDDNFATIIKAVANGRNVYRNIRHAIQFLLSGNMAGIFSVLYTSMAALPMPFAPVHLLFINLLTDSLPAIAIGMEPQEDGLLDQPPRNPQEGILTKTFLCAIFLQGGLIAVCTMLSFYTGLFTGGAGTASTMAFATLTLARLFHGFNCRSEHSIVRLGFRGNLWSLMAFETGVLLLAAVLFLPGLQVLFAAADLSVRQLLTAAVLAFLPTVAIQTVKILREAQE